MRRIALLFSLILLPACASRETAPDRETIPTTPVDGGSLVVGVPGDPDNLNPLIRTSTFSGNVLGIINPGLVLMNTQLEWEPSLATHWSWSDDRLELRYFIRPGLKWSDGEPFTARDVVLSAELYMDPRIASNRISNFADITSVEAEDELTVLFRFTRSSPDQIFNSAFGILPAHVVESLDRDQVASWPINRMPITLGPYRIASWESGSRLVLERNPHWVLEPAHLDRIEFKVIPDQSARFLQLQTGEIDMLEEVPPKDIVRLEDKHPEIALYALDQRTIGMLTYNLSRPDLADRRVRQAIAHAIDRRALIEGVIYGYAAPIAGPVLPMHAWAQHPDLKPYERDLQLARTLLAEAGWADQDGDGIVERDGRPLRVEIRTRTGDLIRENGVVIIQRNLRDIGIEAIPKMMELSATLDLVRSGEFDIYYGHSNMRMSLDPSPMYGTGGGFNYSGFSRADVDSLIHAGLELEDRGLARPYWLRFQEIVYEEQPTTMLYALQPHVAIRAEFQDCTPHMLSPWEGIENWWRLPESKEAR